MTTQTKKVFQAERTKKLAGNFEFAGAIAEAVIRGEVTPLVANSAFKGLAIQVKNIDAELTGRRQRGDKTLPPAMR